MFWWEIHQTFCDNFECQQILHVIDVVDTYLPFDRYRWICSWLKKWFQSGNTKNQKARNDKKRKKKGPTLMSNELITYRPCDDLFFAALIFSIAYHWKINHNKNVFWRNNKNPLKLNSKNIFSYIPLSPCHCWTHSHLLEMLLTPVRKATCNLVILPKTLYIDRTNIVSVCTSLCIWKNI